MSKMDINPCMETVIDALDATAKAYPIKALAPELKTEVTPARAESTLRAELNQTPGYKLGLVTALMIMAKTGDLAALDQIETYFGRVAADLPGTPADDQAPLMNQVSRLSKEFSETVQEVAAAMADNHLDPNEKDRVLAELEDLITASVRFKAYLLNHK